MESPQEILGFWLDEIDPKNWYVEQDTLDASIVERFKSTWTAANEGKFSLWLTYPSGALAYIVLMDQFSRNMFRGTAEAFSSDRPALAAAKSAIERGWDMRIDEPARQFFYLPLMHSENLCDQDRCVRLICDRLKETGASNLLHARAHREVIRRFGRFPTRNAALGRSNTPSEQAFLEGAGYAAILQELEGSQTQAA